MLLYLKSGVVFSTEDSGILRGRYNSSEFCLDLFPPPPNINPGQSSNSKAFIIAAILTVN